VKDASCLLFLFPFLVKQRRKEEKKKRRKEEKKKRRKSNSFDRLLYPFDFFILCIRPKEFDFKTTP